MTRYANDGMIKVTWVPSVANIAAPTVAELTAGKDLEAHMTKDGLGLTLPENTVNDAALLDVFDAELPGSFKVQMALTLKRNNVALSDPWSFFARMDEGVLAVRRGIAATIAWLAAQPAEMYPGIVGQKSPVPPASNEPARMTINIYGTAAPNLDAVVAA